MPVWMGCSGYEDATLAAVRKETEAALEQANVRLIQSTPPSSPPVMLCCSAQVMRRALSEQRGFYEKQISELRMQAATSRERIQVLERRLAAGSSPPPLM
jgi:hypothetical protein